MRLCCSGRRKYKTHFHSDTVHSPETILGIFTYRFKIVSKVLILSIFIWRKFLRIKLMNLFGAISLRGDSRQGPEEAINF